MKHLLILLSLSLMSLGTKAQIVLKLNLQNNHLWRGMEVADGALLLSDLSYTFADRHVTLGLWGGTNTTGKYKEFNHYLTVRAGGFDFNVCDTYNFSPGAAYNNREYFNYRAHSTGRFLNVTANYRLSQCLPLLLSWSTIVFGRDRNEQNTAQKYSTFCYAEYPVYKTEQWRVDAGIGAAFALHKAGSKSHFYGSEGGVAQISLNTTYNLRIKQYTLPVYAKGMWNPQTSKAYFQIGAEVSLPK